MRLMAIRQARLEPLALSASGHERRFNGWAAASGEKRFNFSAGIAWFGDILNIEEAVRRDWTPFGLWQIGCRCQAVASAEGLRTTLPRWYRRMEARGARGEGRGARGVGRGNSGLWSVPREAESRELAVRGRR